MNDSHKNDNLVQLISELKKLSIEQNVAFWKRIALELEKPTRRKRVVNISRINKFSNKDEVVIIPGKVLSAGELDHKVTVCAHTFSQEAEKKISEKGKIITLQELMKQNPKGQNIRILG
jgi:large subunit ribosomal protein L18e